MAGEQSALKLVGSKVLVCSFCGINHRVTESNRMLNLYEQNQALLLFHQTKCISVGNEKNPLNDTTFPLLFNSVELTL